jgi:hypothetical protein
VSSFYSYKKLDVKKFSRNIDLNEKIVLRFLENSVYKPAFSYGT